MQERLIPVPYSKSSTDQAVSAPLSLSLTHSLSLSISCSIFYLSSSHSFALYRYLSLCLFVCLSFSVSVSQSLSFPLSVSLARLLVAAVFNPFALTRFLFLPIVSPHQLFPFSLSLSRPTDSTSLCVKYFERDGGASLGVQSVEDPFLRSASLLSETNCPPSCPSDSLHPRSPWLSCISLACLRLLFFPFFLFRRVISFCLSILRIFPAFYLYCSTIG